MTDEEFRDTAAIEAMKVILEWFRTKENVVGWQGRIASAAWSVSRAMVAARKADGDEHPISQVELSARARRCLERIEVRTMEDVAQLTARQLLNIKNCGTTTLNEIKRMLSLFGLELKAAGSS